MDWIASIVVGLLAMSGTLGGAYLANRKNTALIAYRLEELEKKVDRHNSVIERTYGLEKRAEVLSEELRDVLRRLSELERKEA